MYTEIPVGTNTAIAGSPLYARIIRKNGRKALIIASNIIKEHNFYKGLEKYILDSFPKISLVYAGIDIGTKYIPYLNRIAKISDMVRIYVHHFWKQLTLFAGIMSIYTIINSIYIFRGIIFS